jgi:acyl-CoA synthetase (AMP-forming)/AMP-acid ligase II
MNIVAAFEEMLQSRPQVPAYIHPGSEMTWGQVDRMGQALRQQLADVPEDATIGIISHSRPAVVAAFVSLFMAGRATLMLNPFQSPSRLMGQLDERRLAVVVADLTEISDELRAYAEASGIKLIGLTVEQITVIAPRGLKSDDYHKAQDKGGVILLTSGTTGPPKHIALARHTLDSAIVSGLVVLNYSPDGSGKADPFVHLLAFPLGNISGVYQSLPLAVAGGSLYLMEKFSVAAYVDAITRYPQKMLGLPPAAIRMIMDADLPPDIFSPAERCLTGASSLDPDLQLAFEQRFGVPVYTAYGATEFGGIVCFWSSADHAKFASVKRGSVGRLVPGVQLRIIDPLSGAPVGPGIIGRIEVQADRIGEQWLTTNDLGLLDEDGFLFVRGRADDIIVRGGFKIDPAAINAALLQHPAIADAETIGRPDPRLGQVPVTAVVLRQGHAAPPEADLSAFARERLLPYEMPVTIRAVDQIPRNNSMKLDKLALKALLG